MALAARNALLKHLRLKVQALPSANPNPFGSLNLLLRRHFASEEARGTFLDKPEVTDRVISVVKNFHKVDPSKVCISNSSFVFLNLLQSAAIYTLIVAPSARPRL
ncbi:hypothetical protein AAC387_Pa04g1289 [Persea americana]